jgi:hypothetical protein
LAVFSPASSPAIVPILFFGCFWPGEPTRDRADLVVFSKKGEPLGLLVALDARPA